MAVAIAIKVENLSKAYQLGEISTGTLARDMERWFAKMAGKEDPYLKIGEAIDPARKLRNEVVWSLKDINFEIEVGSAVGIIGRNGAGKSTLLKILSRVTSPTLGIVKARGRIASLLEVGTGFHQELTGRENIFLNGAILGMQKEEIRRKFDSIVDFSGVEKYIDTPVKRYSSGMYVRLAFAVAAYLEANILIVDEVLAVGDAEFQKKCLGKMKEVSLNEGRTVLFVSHNMGAIKNLTTKVIYLKNGQLKNFGHAQEMVDEYLNEGVQLAIDEDLNYFRRNASGKEVRIASISINNTKGQLSKIKQNDNTKIELKIWSNKDIAGVVINFIIRNNEGDVIATISSMDEGITFNPKMEREIVVEIELEKNVFVAGKYFATFGLAPSSEGFAYDSLIDYPLFEVLDDVQFTYWQSRPTGVVNLNKLIWKVK